MLCAIFKSNFETLDLLTFDVTSSTSFLRDNEWKNEDKKNSPSNELKIKIINKKLNKSLPYITWH